MLAEIEELLNVLTDIVTAKSEGRMIILPCKLGDVVYTIEYIGCPCDICTHGEEVGYSSLMCVNMHKEYECPPPQYKIKEHKCTGFEVYADVNGNAIISDPGEWGYEGLEQFYGCDGNIYYNYNEAEAAVRKLIDNKK